MRGVRRVARGCGAEGWWRRGGGLEMGMSGADDGKWGGVGAAGNAAIEVR